MKDKMFCSKCGAADQTADSYCRQCGEWVADPNRRRGRFGRTSRESKINKMRVLQIVSIGLSLASTFIIISFLNGGDIDSLKIAALFGFLVAVYQIIALMLGRKVLSPNHENDGTASQQIKILPVAHENILNAADTGEFVTPASVIENTTELLEPVPRYKEPKQKNNR